MSTTKILTDKQLEVLSKPFDSKTLGVRVLTVNKTKTAALLACYLSHTDVYTRIEKVDPAWSSTIMGVQMGAKTCFVWVALTILGVTRANMGEGEDLKSATSDAIKRAAMLFGIGRYLYDAEPVWVDYDDSRDWNRVYKYADYEGGRRQDQPRVPLGPAESSTPAPAPARPKTKDEVETELFAVAKDLGLDDQALYNWAEEFTKKDLDKISTADLERFLEHLQSEAGRNGHAAAPAPARRGFGR